MSFPRLLNPCTDGRRATLAGQWQCRLDPEGIGANSGWALQDLEHLVQLPGSLDQAGLGEPNLDTAWLGGLSRKFKYTGKAWFAKIVTLPACGPGGSVRLHLERSHWFIQPWVNGESLEEGDSLSVHQEWDLTRWAGQEVRLALCIDNTPRIPIGRICHAITDWTQTNWNGVIGGMSVEACTQESPWFISATPGPEGLTIVASGLPGSVVRLTSPDLPEVRKEGVFGLDGCFCFLVERALLPEWSEDEPNTFLLALQSSGESSELSTGYRRFSVSGSALTINDLPIFLRGTLDACVFPETGYPPMEAEPWHRIFAKAKEFGLNHIRFHSWCPPEAAFAAADQAGIIVQAELPLWTGKWPLSSDPGLLDFCRREAYRILRSYGSHPSFCLFTLGNEMSFYGEEPEVEQLLCDLKRDFPHILFNFSSHGTYLGPNSDYFVQADNGRPGAENLPLRGSTWFGVGSRFDREMPASTSSCNEAAAQFDRPVISHEVGEWAVFPRLGEAGKYRGVLEPRNYEVIRGQLSANGMESQAEVFTQASGRLSAQLYKEEIETLMRTKGLAGFQLLGLNDFPGQGTATIGMLDSFWEEKGFITGPEFKEFCGPSVPLMASRKFVWTNSETFEADVMAFHSGKAQSSSLSWRLLDPQGGIRCQGETDRALLHPACATKLGHISIDLSAFITAERLELAASIDGGGTNRWGIWVFPDSQPEIDLPEVKVFAWYREDVRTALKEGKTVWLKIHPDRTWTGVPGRFATAFWSPIHFKEQVGTMGTVIQKESPLLAGFPTENHSEWHWWEILTRSKAMVLNSLPKSFRPTLQVIDRYERNWKLGTVFDAMVGEGKLLVTLIDFETQGRPAAAQLEASLKKHLSSGEFCPKQSVTLADLDGVFSEEP